MNITVASNLTEIDNLKATSTTHLNNIDANKVNILAINTNLTNNYQTNSQLATTLGDYVLTSTLTSDYLTSSQISTSYYDKAYIGTNFYTIGQIQTNYYDKTYIDGLSTGGYTDAQIDTLLDAKLDVSETSGNITIFPVIDCLRPLYVNQGMSFPANASVSINDANGLSFTKFGGSNVVLKINDATNYINVEGDTIGCYVSSDDSAKELNIGNGNVNFKNNISMEGTNINVSSNSGITIYKNNGNAFPTFRIQNTNNYWQWNGYDMDVFNNSNDLGTLMRIGSNSNDRIQIGGGTARVGINKTGDVGVSLGVNGIVNFSPDEFRLLSEGMIREVNDGGNLELDVCHQNQLNFVIQADRTAVPASTEIKMEMTADRINLNSRFNVNASRDIMFNGNRARIYENNNLNF